MTEANGNFKRVVWWVFGILGTLLVAGVIGSVGTYASVRSIGTDLGNLRTEVSTWKAEVREDIKDVEDKLDGHIQQTIRGEAHGGGGGGGGGADGL